MIFLLIIPSPFPAILSIIHEFWVTGHNTRMGRGKKRPATSQDGTDMLKKTKSLNSSCPICEQAFEPGQEYVL